MEKGQMIAAIVERLKVRLDADDPAFVLVELNRLALEEAAQAVVDRLEPIPGRIENAAAALLTDVEQKATHRSAEAVAQATLRIQDEVDRSRATAAALIEDVARANRNVNAPKWFAIAAGVGLALAGLAFGGGYWLATAVGDNEALRAGRVLATAEGRAAMRLAELGQARTLLECNSAGWTLKDGYCYGTASNGRTVGWRVR